MKQIVKLLIVAGCICIIQGGCAYTDETSESDTGTVSDLSQETINDSSQGTSNSSKKKKKSGSSSKKKKKSGSSSSKKKKKSGSSSKKKSGSALKDTAQSGMHYICIEIECNQSITSIFTEFPEITNVYLDGQPLEIIGDMDAMGNLRGGFSVCYCNVPTGTYELTVETDGLDPVSVELDVNKQGMKNIYGEHTNASVFEADDMAYYAFELKLKNRGTELELFQKNVEIDE